MDNELAKMIFTHTAGFVIGEVFTPITHSITNNIPTYTLSGIGAIGMFIPNMSVRRFSLSLIFDDLATLLRRDLTTRRQI